MKTDWLQKTLAEVIAEMRNGLNCKQTKSGVGSPISRIETISDGTVNFDRVGYASISDNERSKYRLRRGDILFSHINSNVHVGKSAILDDDRELYHGVNLMLIRPSSELYDRYLHYFFQSLYLSGYWRTICKQSVNQASVNQGDIGKVIVRYPRIEEQKRIVAILGEAFEGLDRAAANAKKNLANARELFDSYLAAALMGGDSTLGEVVEIRTGKLDANAAVENGPYPFFTCSREIYAIDKYAFDCEALLLAGNNAVGDFNVKHYAGKFNAYQRTYVITIPDVTMASYRYLYFQLIKNLAIFKRQAVGTGTKFLKLPMIKSLPISIPLIAEQTRIAEKLDELLQHTESLSSTYTAKLNSISELKQSILQKAFAGELPERLDLAA